MPHLAFIIFCPLIILGLIIWITIKKYNKHFKQKLLPLNYGWIINHIFQDKIEYTKNNFSLYGSNKTYWILMNLINKKSVIMKIKIDDKEMKTINDMCSDPKIFAYKKYEHEKTI